MQNSIPCLSKCAGKNLLGSIVAFNTTAKENWRQTRLGGHAGLSKKEHTLFIYKAVHCCIKKLSADKDAPNALKAAKSEAIIKTQKKIKNKIKISVLPYQ